MGPPVSLNDVKHPYDRPVSEIFQKVEDGDYFSALRMTDALPEGGDRDLLNGYLAESIMCQLRSDERSEAETIPFARLFLKRGGYL